MGTPNVSIDQIVKRSEDVRRELAELSAELDRNPGDGQAPSDLIWENGLTWLNIPAKYGGLGDGTAHYELAKQTDVWINLSAGESSAGMAYIVQASVSHEIFGEESDLADAVKAQIAEEMRDHNVRLAASNAEAGSKPVTSRRAPGGIIVTGTKTFNTNSGGMGYANVGTRFEDLKGRHYAVIPFDSPNVHRHGDWDVMGQRATNSQSITYDDVFVPDGWHYHGAGLSPVRAAWIFVGHAAILIGPALAALDAEVEYAREMNRSSMPNVFPSPREDVLMQRRVGQHSTRIASATALIRQAARRLEAEYAAPSDDGTELLVETFRAKAHAVDVAIYVTSDLFELTGARSTATRYNFDRFWRNARTFATHDPLDSKLVWVGSWEMAKEKPPASSWLRV